MRTGNLLGKEEKIKLINTKELAKILSLAPRTLEIWRSKGKGPASMKLGKNVRYSMLSVNKWMAENTAKVR